MQVLPHLEASTRAAILRIASKYGVNNIRVFGSMARGEQTPASDLDLLVDLAPGRTIFDLAGFVSEVEDLLGHPVDAVTPGGLRYLRESVLTEAIPL